MSAIKSSGLENGYRVEPADNGGWILYDNPPVHHLGRVLGAFSDGTDLVKYLMRGHTRIGLDAEARAAKERADKLNLEEQDPTPVNDIRQVFQRRALDEGQRAFTAALNSTLDDLSPAVDQWTPEELRRMALPAAPKGVIAPIGQFVVKAYSGRMTEGDSGLRVLCDEVYTGQWSDLEVARRDAIVQVEKGWAAFVYDDVGAVVVEVRP